MTSGIATRSSFQVWLGLVLGLVLTGVCLAVLFGYFLPYYTSPNSFYDATRLAAVSGGLPIYNITVQGNHVGFGSDYPDKFMGLIDTDRFYYHVVQVGDRYLLVRRIRVNGFFLGTRNITGTLKPWDSDTEGGYFTASFSDPKFNDRNQFYTVYLDLTDIDNAAVWHYQVLMCILLLVVGLIWIIASLNVIFIASPSPTPQPRTLKNPNS